MKTDIKNRNDLSKLVHSFYDKIRVNDEIGPFFNETIRDWDEHLEKLTDFWESNLFAVRKYYGNPPQAHVEVDQKFHHTVNPDIFGLWLNLWFETLEELFEGEHVETLKFRARKMGTVFMMAIYENRKQNPYDSTAQTNV
ncbi:hemoglobin-like protein [Flavobacterium saliperosum S13]|uniref:Hemoglobin n=2 Tax=Flavobacterium saliperosum TaxID=329186 RepID=A0A1G4V8B2_9FLAO|nr:group III truncated hemoglobin [Flavobacterium saliperosum]ESU28056.1 hemoglobin-like protein [Flavobacterium saliperosum S13]SCX02854.1 hemoglobin [Flavobacterium saliperosum]